MKMPIVALVFICALVSTAQTDVPRLVSTANTIYLPLVFDPQLSLRNGAQMVATCHRELVLAEDRLVDALAAGVHRPNKAVNALGRLGKYVLLDTPVDYFSVVLAHEYFGHGARYRELDIDKVNYGFDRPPPYGYGGGQASVNIVDPISNHELLAIWEGGLEAHALINRELALRWMASGEIDYRAASQYFWSYQIAMNYIQETDRDLADGQQDNDPRAYVRLLNAEAGYTDPAALRISVKDLQSKANLNALNPFVLLSMYSVLKGFLWDGERSMQMPSMRWGSVRYLPSLRVGLTPLGIEYHLENYVRIDERVALIDLRYGDRTFAKKWWGAGAFVQSVISGQFVSVDMSCDIWKQPGIEFTRISASPTTGGWGAAFSVRAYRAIPGAPWPLAAAVELGYKSNGFLDGYSLAAAPILGAGVAWRL